MLAYPSGLGRTVGRTGRAERPRRVALAGRVHPHPEPLSPSEDVISGFPSASGSLMSKSLRARQKLALRLRDGLPTLTAYQNRRENDAWLIWINLSDGSGCHVSMQGWRLNSSKHESPTRNPGTPLLGFHFARLGQMVRVVAFRADWNRTGYRECIC